MWKNGGLQPHNGAFKPCCPRMPYKDTQDPRNLEHKRNHYYNNKESYRARNKVIQERITVLLRDAKDKPCMDCGVKYPYYVMDLDHRPGTAKNYTPSRLPSVGSVRKALEEIAKCDAVCSNCHRERTFQREQGVSLL